MLCVRVTICASYPIRLWLALCLLLCITSCKSHKVQTRPAQEAQTAPKEQTRGERVVNVKVNSDQAASLGSGALVAWWNAEGDPKNSFAKLSTDVGRFQVTKLSSFPSEGLELSLTIPGNATELRVVFDNRGVFLADYFGRRKLPSASVKLGKAVDELEIGLSAELDTEPKPASCADSGLTRIKVTLSGTQGQTGVGPTRTLCARVPPSYSKSPTRRYPVLYLLPGLGSGDDVYMRGDKAIGKLVDSLGLDLIVVGVDSSTPAGSTYFTNNTVGGRWLEAFDTMVSRVDNELRTMAEPSCRYLMGQSTGGFNSIYLMLTHPEAFGGVAASAPDGLDLEHWLLKADKKNFKPRWRQWMRFETRLAEAIFPNFGQFISYALSWSPRPDQVPPFAMPLHEDDSIDEAVLEQWRAHSPIVMLSDPSKAAFYSKVLADKIFLSVGRDDEFDLYAPTKRFSEKLESMAIHHEFVSTNGGHGNRNERFEKGLRFLSRTKCLRNQE